MLRFVGYSTVAGAVALASGGNQTMILQRRAGKDPVFPREDPGCGARDAFLPRISLFSSVLPVSTHGLRLLDNNAFQLWVYRQALGEMWQDPQSPPDPVPVFLERRKARLRKIENMWGNGWKCLPLDLCLPHQKAQDVLHHP